MIAENREFESQFLTGASCWPFRKASRACYDHLIGFCLSELVIELIVSSSSPGSAPSATWFTGTDGTTQQDWRSLKIVEN